MDPDLADLEARALFGGAWLCAAHESELVAPGSFVVLETLSERTLVVRGADLELHAYADRCVHRGTPLTEGESGRFNRLEITCPYHGLRYDLAGRVLDPPPRQLSPCRGMSLDPARVAVWNGFVLVCRGSGGPSLESLAGSAPPWFGRASLHALRLERRTIHDVNANWKLLVANFQESHHFTWVHPGLEARTPWRRSSSHDFGGAWLGGSMALDEPWETVSTTGRRGRRSLIAGAADRRAVRDALLFPTWLTSLQPDYFLSYRLTPRSIDCTRVVADIFVHAETPPEASLDVLEFWDITNAEDRRICERQQRGVSAPGFRAGPYAESEDGVHAFEQRVARALVDELRREGVQ